MIRLTLLASVMAFGTFANENRQESHFNNLPIDFASPIGVFDTDVGWRYAAGLGLELESEYHGSGESATEADPYVEVSYRDQDWEFQSNIVSNRVIYRLNNQWYLSGWINSEEGREEAEASDNSLQGLGDIDDMIEYGGAVSWKPSDKLTVSLISQMYTGGDPDKGAVGFIVGHYRVYDSTALKVDISADVSFANGEHLTTEFGITPEQAENSSYEAYKIDSGLKSYGVGINAVYSINDNMYFSFGADYEILASDSADSPLVKAGSDSEIEVGASFIYKF